MKNMLEFADKLPVVFYRTFDEQTFYYKKDGKLLSTKNLSSVSSGTRGFFVIKNGTSFKSYFCLKLDARDTSAYVLEFPDCSEAYLTLKNVTCLTTNMKDLDYDADFSFLTTDEDSLAIYAVVDGLVQPDSLNDVLISEYNVSIDYFDPGLEPPTES